MNSDPIIPVAKSGLPPSDRNLQRIEELEARIALLEQTERELRLMVEDRARELRLSESKLGTLSQFAPVGIYWTDAQGRCLYLNKHWSELTGMSVMDGLGEGWTQAIHPDDRATVLREWSRATVEKNEFRLNYRYLSPHGTIRRVIGVAAPTRYENGEISGYVGVVSDLTHLHQAQAELADSHLRLEILNERLRIATESADIGVWDWNFVTDVLECDSQMHRIYGVSPDEVRKESRIWRRLVHPDDVARARRMIEEAIAGARDFHADFRITRPDGEVRYIEAHGILSRSPEGKPLRMVGVNWDVTERKLLERDALEAGERERNYIGLALHDGLCQEVGGIGLLCNAMEEHLRRQNHPEAERAALIAELMNDVIVKARKLAHGLSPLSVENRCLTEALRHLAQVCGQIFPQIRFQVFSEVSQQLRGARATQLYFIASEAVFNASRHARPSLVQIYLVESEAELILTVTDDGNGTLSQLLGEHEGLGLRSMRSRAWNLGGDLKLAENLEKPGIQVCCRIPKTNDSLPDND